MQLTHYENAKTALAEYTKVDDIKDFRDKAVAVQAYAKQANDYDLERDASIARVRAERRAGELLRDMDKAQGVLKQGDKLPQSPATTTGEQPKTLSEMGLTKDQSSKWQKLADVPEDVFEKAINNPAGWTNTGNHAKPISGSQILKTESPAKDPAKKIDTACLWLWGRLRDMENDKIFNRPLSEYLDEMTDGMKPDADRIIPKLKQWINDYE